MSLSRLTCATLIITDACAFISVHVPGVGGSCEISTTTRPQVTGCGRDDASMFITSGSKRNWPLDTESKGRLVRQRVRGWNRCPCVFPLRAKRTKRLEEDDEQGRELVELRQRKLDEWQALIKSGKVNQVARALIDADLIEQVEALESGSRRSGRRSRARQGQQQDLYVYDDDEDDEDDEGLRARPKPKTVEVDWRDAGSAVKPARSGRRRAGNGVAAERAPGGQREGDRTGRQRLKEKREGSDELAARLVADLGLPVVPAAETGQDSGYRHGGAAGQRGHGLAVAGNEVRDEYPPDDFQDFTLTDDDEDDDGYEDEDEDDDYYGSEYDDGGGDGEHGPGGLVSKLMATVRREERKRGKEAADTVIGLVVSAAERDGVRDDAFFSSALKSLARMGRLDLSMRVQELRDRYFRSGEILRHDRSTTAGLSVAWLRKGEESVALELFHAAMERDPGPRSGRGVHEAIATASTVAERDDGGKLASGSRVNRFGRFPDEEKREMEFQRAISAVEGEVLPELLGLYLEQADAEKSRQAALGVRDVMDRALQQGQYSAAARPSMSPDPLLEEASAGSVEAGTETTPAPTTPPLTSGEATSSEEERASGFRRPRRRPRSHRPMPVGAFNQIIRLLGKADRLTDVFEVLDGMTELGISPDHETLEFVTNAAIKEVEFETRAVSMKTIPRGKVALPEVVFVGRSNVGKSSLVNMLVNRKALAPTSDVPGYTKHFNYYAVNKGRRRSPSFFLVDVPGLGYAEADDGRMDSWKSTLQRYLSVRETLRVVFHLVDSRIGLQSADRNLMSLMMTENKGRSNYVVVLTKCDKVGAGKRVSTTKRVREALDACGFSSSTPIIATSAKSRQGRIEMLGYLRLMFDVDRRREGTPVAARDSLSASLASLPSSPSPSPSPTQGHQEQ